MRAQGLGAPTNRCYKEACECPHKPITQGVFGEIVDSSNTLEENIEVDIFTTLNGGVDCARISVLHAASTLAV